jgi:hypothetical protein
MVDVGDGTWTLHAIILGKITKNRIKQFEEMFLNLVLDLMDRGFDHLDTWVEYDNEKSIRFAEHFGFRETSWLKVMNIEGQEFVMTEMRYEFPELNKEA